LKTFELSKNECYESLTRTVVLINLSWFLLDLSHLPGSVINLAPRYSASVVYNFSVP
jgi:hypothetical protein